MLKHEAEAILFLYCATNKNRAKYDKRKDTP